MKTICLLSILVALNTAFGQSTATDVTVTDCSGNSHNLFNELDAGKIIVVGWAMPCGACASPLLNVHNTILSYQMSNPGMIEFWLNDDYANTSCQSLTGWANSNGITSAIYFSASQLDMLDYGSAGMPKVVVLGCTDHQVYYNVNNSPGGNAFSNALQTAISDVTAGCQQSGLNEESKEILPANCVFNPETDQVEVKFDKVPSGNCQVAIYTLEGQLVFSNAYTLTGNDAMIQIPTSFWKSGLYLLRLETSGIESSYRVNVIH